jgi:hypothetical protein
MVMARRLIVLIAIASSVLGMRAPAAAQLSSPAALLIFPRIVTDVAGGVDTIVQLANTSDEPVEVRCLYEDEPEMCSGTGTCSPDPSSCQGTCLLHQPPIAFRVRLTPNQPLGWSAARGVVGPDGSTNAGTIIPGVGSPYDGLLLCVVVDDGGRPDESNVLIGTASVETDAQAVPIPDVPQYTDAARYDAIGFAAVAGGNDGDEILRLGGADPEYGACPTTLELVHPFDGAVVEAGGVGSTVHTVLSLLPCGGNPLAPDPGLVTVQVRVYNEFGQRFQLTHALFGSLVLPLYRFDTTDETRSIFYVGVEGTLTGQTDLNGLQNGVQSGVLGVALEEYERSGAPLQYHAAVPLWTEGHRTDPAVLAMLHPPCDGDCNQDGEVKINELLLGVNVGLDAAPVETCLADDDDGNGAVQVDELVRAVQSALTSCPAPKVPTTPVEPESTPQPTPPAVTAMGPDITFLGIASADDVAQTPVGSDDEGRPIFTWPVGQGLSLIVEARRGASHSQVGTQASVPGGASLPDLQVILSNPLGDGSQVLCDTDRPTVGGVPAVDPFEFSDAPGVVLAINDLGCRADNGLGEPQGRPAGETACTRAQPSGKIGTVVSNSTVQFCIPIALAWAFPEGDTIVAARVRDRGGNVGPIREMVLRVQPAP